MATEKPRYTVIVDDETLKEIDDFRFDNRYPSRSAASVELIKLGIEVLNKQLGEDPKTKKALTSIGEGINKELLDMLIKLSPEQQLEVKGYVNCLIYKIDSFLYDQIRKEVSI